LLAHDVLDGLAGLGGERIGVERLAVDLGLK
jgi:hypothetical protein